MKQQQPVSRRSFLSQSTAVAAGIGAFGAVNSGIGNLGASSTASHCQDGRTSGDGEPAQEMKKAVKIGMVQAGRSLTDKFKLLKELGYDGVELNSPGLNQDEAKQARDEAELPIHGVVDSKHWNDTLSHPDPEVRARGVDALQTALRDASAIGATSVLLVPAVVSKEVSYGDAYERSQAEIRKAIPLAEELGIKILLENVWNNFLLSPLEEARYIDELESDVMGAYFDVGNIVRYGWPEHWIRTLGHRIGKLDIKEYSRQKQLDEGIWKGFQVELLEGDCDWPVVMTALRDIGFSGWGTAEIPGGNRERLTDIAERMDRIFAS